MNTGSRARALHICGVLHRCGLADVVDLRCLIWQFLGACDDEPSLIVTGSNDRTAKVWDASTGQLLHTLVGHSLRVMAVAIQGAHVATGSADHLAKVWDATAGQLRHTLAGHDGPVHSVAFRGTNVLSGSTDRTSKVWDIISGKLLRTLAGSFCPNVHARQGNIRVHAAGGSREVVVASITPDQIKYMLYHGSLVEAVAIHGATLVTSSTSCTNVWDIVSGHLRYTLKNHGGGLAMQGTIIITGGPYETAEVWDVTSGKLQHKLVGHSAALTTVAARV